MVFIMTDGESDGVKSKNDDEKIDESGSVRNKLESEKEDSDVDTFL